MSSAQPLVDAWNTRDPEAVVAVFAPDGVRHQFAFEEAHLDGRDAIREMVGAIMHACPDCTLANRGEFESGGSLVLEWTFEADIENDFGPIPGNGQHIVLPGASVITMRDDGLIAEERAYWDTATFLAVSGMLG